MLRVSRSGSVLVRLTRSSNLSPGGWLELQDLDFPLRSQDGTLNESTTLYKWGKLIEEGNKKVGLDIITSQYQKYMIDAGFVDVEVRQYIWPSNPWPADPKLKELGKWNLVNLLDAVQAVSMAVLTRIMGMTRDEVEVLLSQVRKDLKNRKIHAFSPM